MHPQLCLVLDETKCQSSFSSGHRWSSAASKITPSSPLWFAVAVITKVSPLRKKERKQKRVKKKNVSVLPDLGTVVVMMLFVKGWGGVQL